jgi:hypothetical protein
MIKACVHLLVPTLYLMHLISSMFGLTWLNKKEMSIYCSFPFCLSTMYYFFLCIYSEQSIPYYIYSKCTNTSQLCIWCSVIYNSAMTMNRSVTLSYTVISTCIWSRVSAWSIKLRTMTSLYPITPSTVYWSTW